MLPGFIFRKPAKPEQPFRCVFRYFLVSCAHGRALYFYHNSASHVNTCIIVQSDLGLSLTYSKKITVFCNLFFYLRCVPCASHPLRPLNVHVSSSGKPGDVTFRSDIDLFSRGCFGKPGHGHDITAVYHNKSGPGAKRNIRYDQSEILRTSQKFGIVR
jgi:hypothetical protein